ncbi:MAG: murein biosynthesis integral membrane protein MurJ [Clostridia bacterium]|nr:murein biosynthesis integral membrane protein MurJ [Clostridia bacterium]
MANVKAGGVARAAGTIMIAMALSRIFGYVRDVVIYTNFGQDYRTDAYNAAFSIPDFLYYLLVGGALSSAFIPVFSSYLATNQEEEGWEVVSTIFNIVMVLMLIGIALGLIFTPQLIALLVPGFTGEAFSLTVLLTRVMFAQSFFMALNGISQGILHSYKHFFAPALGSVLYNLGIIVIGILLVSRLGILGFSIGVVIGAMLNFLVQVPALLKVGVKYKPIVNLKHPGVKKIFVLILPVFIGLSVSHLNLFVNQYLASSLSYGMISALRAAQRIMQLPIGVFAIAVALAVFPTLTGHAARKEEKEFKATLSLGVRTVIFITLPAAVGLIALRVPIVRAMFQQGQFTSGNTEATAYALLFYSLGLIGYSTQQVLNRAFYALQDTKSPVTIGIITIIINIALNFILIKPLGHGGLALAYSIAGLVNMVLLLYYLRVKIGHIGGREMLKSFSKTLIASLVMGAIVYFSVAFFELNFGVQSKIMQVTEVILGIGLGALAYGVIVTLMNMEEAAIAKEILLRKFRKKKVGKQGID